MTKAEPVFRATASMEPVGGVQPKVEPEGGGVTSTVEPEGGNEVLCGARVARDIKTKVK